ncbi:glycosyltransferase family 4 protein [Acidipila sp. EB88]|uniref:glycosyltransferase family 4 protein n=1 Tax=Acidipila sp. EB88 TaxID=2305226 RepID=UPI000F5D82D6|nr:glycosyltransferase family 4 protein [Acidipila sp. EB88]RRA49815.1 glycosyltransferase [Acidipila sp. EB88]
MNVAISVVRPFHVSKMANALRKHVDSISIWSTAPRRYFGHLDDSIRTHIVPAPVEIATRILKLQFSPSVYQRNIVWWDRAVGAMMGKSDLVIGFATQALSTGKAARKRGAAFVLDRACPFVDFQQQLVRDEAEKTGASFTPEADWFRERQLAEYEEADVILVPSRYTAQTFPVHLQSKLLLAPLLGRAKSKGAIKLARNTPFTVGVLGGNPLRKGYLYLLQAWATLNLPNSKLLIRSSGDFSGYPLLAELLRATPNVELIEYVPNIAEFYQKCDLFVLPSMDDGFGMALFEAMANGVPSIATRNCGASELLTDGEDGLVIDAGSVDQLASAILSLYEDEERRQAIAIAGQATVERISEAHLYEDALCQLLTLKQPAAVA